MPIHPALQALHADRLVLRRPEDDDAAVYRRLWTERDPRVPPHRRIGPDGRPTLADIVVQLRAERQEGQPGILTVVRTGTGDVIGYCGLTVHGHGSQDEPELVYELLRAVHGRGYATEAGRVVVDWAVGAGYRRLWAGVRDWNAASRRVLDKLGFGETGDVRPDAHHGDDILTVREL
jgi:RimJ/RimL family protein N-acetyltransferase